MESGLVIVVGSNTKESLDLHHRTYVRKGFEKLDDLVPVCRECHNTIHSLYNKKRNTLWKITEQVRIDKTYPKEVTRKIEYHPRVIEPLEDVIVSTITILKKRYPQIRHQIEDKIRKLSENQIRDLYNRRIRITLNRLCYALGIVELNE